MKEERVVEAAFEVWNFDRMSIEKFLHYAYVAKLLLPDGYRAWLQKRAERPEGDSSLGNLEDRERVDDEEVDAMWCSGGITPNEGSYIRKQLNTQLRHAISELHAFREEIQVETNVLERLHYPVDTQCAQAWVDRPTTPRQVDSGRPQKGVFPRVHGGNLVVPAPPESTEE